MAWNRRLASLLLLSATLAGGCAPSEPRTPPPVREGLGGPAPAPKVFTTPSSNITCALSDDAVRCDITDRDWKPPSPPADCTLGWGNGFSIENGQSGLACAGDTLAGSAESTLRYGSSLTAGSIQCASESAGLTCKSETTGHGFTLARAAYALF